MSGCRERSFSSLGRPKGRPMGRSPRGAKNQLLQFQLKHYKNLIPSASYMCAPRIKVGEQSDEWLLRKNVFVLGAPHGALSPWGALPVGRSPRGAKNQLLQFQLKRSQNLIPSAHTLCASNIKV